MQVHFNLFTLTLTLSDAQTGSHQGRCDADISYLRCQPRIRRQLAKLDPEAVASELKEFGTWDATELACEDDNLSRILWIACGNIVEEASDKKRARETAKELNR